MGGGRRGAAPAVGRGAGQTLCKDGGEGALLRAQLFAAFIQLMVVMHATLCQRQWRRTC
jgi:hypothetical protein